MTSTALLISIKPPHIDEILQGRKTTELRRRFKVPNAAGRHLFLYASTPRQALVGRARIGRVACLPVERLWEAVHGSACVTREQFDAYFAGKSDGYALSLENVVTFANPIAFQELRSRFGFWPPRSYQYMTGELARLLDDPRVERSTLIDDSRVPLHF